MSPGFRTASWGWVCTNARDGDSSAENTSMLELEAPGAKDRWATSDGGKRMSRFEPVIWQYTLAMTLN